MIMMGDIIVALILVDSTIKAIEFISTQRGSIFYSHIYTYILCIMCRFNFLFNTSKHYISFDL